MVVQGAENYPSITNSEAVRSLRLGWVWDLGKVSSNFESHDYYTGNTTE